MSSTFGRPTPPPGLTTEEWPELPADYDPNLHAPDLPLEEIDDAEIEPAPEEAREGWIYPYTPHAKQELAGEYLVDEMLFGGAAGPGKQIGYWRSV